MTGGGLYLMRFDEARKVLEISLMDWWNVQALATGEKAEDIYAHFLTLRDHAVRDAFCYGVVTGLIAATADVQSGVPHDAPHDAPHGEEAGE